MGLEIEGVPIITRGDFSVLLAGLGNDAPQHCLDVLAAWVDGVPLRPSTVHECLDIGCRISTRVHEPAGQAALTIIDIAVARIEADFPDWMNG